MARSKKFIYGLRYRSPQNEKGEWFAVGITESRNVNLWHFSKGLVRLYTFKGVPGKYDNSTFWNVKLCQEMLADVMSPNPSVEVRRFVVNGQVLFSSGPATDKTPLPRTPDPLTEEQAELVLQKEANWKEEQRMFREDPAPLILYGKHPGYWKEYAWKLFPNKRKRRDIEPGDLVMVMSNQGPIKIKVTRIEEAGDKEQPTKWVIHKIRRKPKPENVPEQAAEDIAEDQEPGE